LLPVDLAKVYIFTHSDAKTNNYNGDETFPDQRVNERHQQNAMGTPYMGTAVQFEQQQRNCPGMNQQAAYMPSNIRPDQLNQKMLNMRLDYNNVYPGM
jgi:hypothetical protein